MKIAVVGMGLMGGSLCKAIKHHTNHTVLGLDTDSHTVARALACGAIDRAIVPEELAECAITFLCLFPDTTISFAREHVDCFKSGSIVADICGVKQAIVDALEPLFLPTGVRYVGTHPMAGREFSGFAYADDRIFQGASFILTPTAKTCPLALHTLHDLAESLGFGRIVTSTPADHDKSIAFTSQLAHVVSNAYIKSPTLWNESGFSAGSFQDLTRVAKLNEEMWSTLFLLNRPALLFELDTIIGHLQEYRAALADGDKDTLRELLKDGRIRKEMSLIGDATPPEEEKEDGLATHKQLD